MRALLIIALACGCAGAGNSYPCDADAGTCGGTSTLDAGQFAGDAIVVAHDGLQNSQTDAVSFGGAIFAVYRHATSFSTDESADVRIVRSDDQGATWVPAAILAADGLDPRQPKLFVFENKLWVVATAWKPSDPLQHETSLRAASSINGSDFSGFMEMSARVSIASWRPRAINGTLYLSIWGADEFFPEDLATGFTLLSSADAAVFATPAVEPATGPGAREGEFLLRSNGEQWLAVPQRAVGSQGALQTFCHGTTSWSCFSIAGTPIESPAMFEWGGAIYVAGSRITGSGFGRTSVWQVLDDQQDLSPVGDIPQGFGDTGAPGVVSLDQTHVLLTFHSTSKLDPKVQQLKNEPSLEDAQAQNYATDVLAVKLNMQAAGAH